MWLKILILVLFALILLSLSGALTYLFRDFGSDHKRLLYALRVRVILAVLLGATLIYGFASGRLTSTAPWDRELHGIPVEQPDSRP